MARQNTNFAKLISPTSIEFAPLPLLIEITHQEESIDPDTGETVPYEWTERKIVVHDPLPTLAEYDAAMEAHLLAEREARGYTTREPDSYLTSAVPRWSQDAKDWVEHRDAVMGYALELINAVQSGQREPPTMAEFKAGLPRIEWQYKEEG